MELGPRFWPIFFEVYAALPRQGPGDRASAARALVLCAELPGAPAIVDLGCGVGGQTLDLADLTRGTIVAVDVHAPWIEHLTRVVAARGLAARVRPLVADMAALPLPPASADLVWSEGALYNLGLDRALAVCCEILRPGGYLVFTDAVWLVADPPPEVKASFDFDYPGMGGIDGVLAAVARAGLALIGHFTLPDAAWWDGFYTPMRARVAALRDVYVGDAEALAVLDQIAREPELHARFGHTYGYEFVIARRPARA